jgi:hypothetical protein
VCPDAQQAKEQLLEIVHQDPHHFDQPRNRWTLPALLSACPWLNAHSLSGLWTLLQRLHIHYKRGTGHVFSPDVHYRDKLADVQAALVQAAAHPDRIVLVYADEITFYRQPTLAQAWEESGPIQPRAELGYRTNLLARVGGFLNVFTGQLTYHLKSKIGIHQLIDLYVALCKCYPDAEVIYVIEDNWPVHFHPDVLAALAPQTLKYPRALSRYWPTEPSAEAQRLNLPIQLLPLPTYAPWTNPIEKLWRWLRQTELHLHRFADDWEGLKACVKRFLDQFDQGSQQLLHYVGLSDPLSLYANALKEQGNA